MQFFGRGEILGLAISDICFGRSLICPVRSGLDSHTRYARRDRTETSRTVFLEEFPDHTLDFRIIAFAEVVVTNSPFRVDKILRRPGFIIKRLPDPVVAVDGDGK